MDCDGVLTDGKLYFTEQGESMKVFNVRDGQGINMWHAAGFESGIISGRESIIVEKRAMELGIKYLKQGSKDKTKCFNEIQKITNVEEDEMAYIGDDIPDICLLKIAGFSAAVGNASKDVFPYVMYKTKSNGGVGAVREVIEMLLTLKQK